MSVAAGLAATRRTQEEQSFDRARTMFGLGRSASAQAASTVTGYVSSTPVSGSKRPVVATPGVCLNDCKVSETVSSRAGVDQLLTLLCRRPGNRSEVQLRVE